MAKNGRVTEVEIGLAVLVILSKSTDRTATVKHLKSNITAHVVLTADDKELSLTRENEELWEQQVRNLKSHAGTDGNIFNDGLVESVKRGVWRLTDQGLAHLRILGLA